MFGIKYALIGAGVVIVIALGTFFIKSALDAKYNEGVAACVAAAGQAASKTKDAALKLLRAELEAEIETQKGLAKARQDAVVRLEQINADLDRERDEAVEELELTTAGITDEEWLCASAITPDAIVDAVRRVQ